jgi:hypothetical protein
MIHFACITPLMPLLRDCHAAAIRYRFAPSHHEQPPASVYTLLLHAGDIQPLLCFMPLYFTAADSRFRCAAFSAIADATMPPDTLFAAAMATPLPLLLS